MDNISEDKPTINDRMLQIAVTIATVGHDFDHSTHIAAESGRNRARKQRKYLGTKIKFVLIR
jgi:hypothetical protein